jgi:pectate lyase
VPQGGMGAGQAGAGSGQAGAGSTAGGSSSGAGGAGAGSAGVNGTAGSGGSGPVKKPIPDFKFPAAVGADQKLGSTKSVTDFDGKMARFVGTGALGSGGDKEGQDPLFSIKVGGSLKNVIIGAPASDGIHCEGSCTIENVWWEDVGEDAITLEGGSSSNVYRISNSGARKATDKVIQHNGGGTLYVKNFLVEDFGKLYRSCGNCDEQYTRKSEFDTVVANGSKSVLAGVNTKYKDSAKFTNIFADLTMKICERYDGNDTGAEPNSEGSGADGTYCVYSASDISWH